MPRIIRVQQENPGAAEAQTAVGDSPLLCWRSSNLGLAGPRVAPPCGTGALLLLTMGLFRLLLEWALDALPRACREATRGVQELVFVTELDTDAPVNLRRFITDG